MIEFAIKAHLAANSAVATRVSDRIYPIRIPAAVDGDKVTYRRKEGARDVNLTSGIDVAGGKFEVVCWGQIYDNAKLLARDVRNAMHGMVNGTFGTGGGLVRVRAVRQTDEEDGYYDPEDGTDQGWFWVACEYSIKYEETAPTF